MNSWTQNCRKSPNFEISEGVPIKTRVPREVIMVILVIMVIAFYTLCQKRTIRFFKKSPCLWIVMHLLWLFTSNLWCLNHWIKDIYFQSKFITCYVWVKILLTGSVPHVNTSNHAPYFRIIILFSHECFVHLSMSGVALRAYALNKCIMMNLMCHPRP